ncbi:MAG: DUF3443 domain-containing protein [Steroidobacteraceae bacterium]
MRIALAGLCAAACLSATGCGGGSGTSPSLGVGGSTPPPASNVASVVVDAGPTSTSPDVNTLFTTVTVCTPGSTTNCQTIDHIEVDTQSFGLRILAQALTLALPVQAAANGGSLLECTAFVDGYSWGPVALADVQISGESASSVPVQVIGDPNFSAVPAECSGQAPAEEDTVAAFGANGILGIGVFDQDCGTQCVTSVDNGFYFACSSTQCQDTAVALATQVTNPVSMFAKDNNGSIIELPSVPAQGAATLTGSLIFGIDTETNNASGSETVLTVDPQFGYLTAAFNATSLNMSFIDSGSSGIFFTDTGIAQCADPSYSQYYCPTAPLNLTVTLQGTNGMSGAVGFSVDSAESLQMNNPTFVALPTLAGTNPIPGSFDFGLPFYYGRRVATALENNSTSLGAGPYVAY